MFRIQLTDDIYKKLDEKIHLLEGNLDQRFSDLELKIGDVKQRVFIKRRPKTEDRKRRRRRIQQ